MGPTENVTMTPTTDARGSEIISRYQAGETIQAIADSVNLSRTSVWRYLRLAGLPIRRTGPALKAQSIRVPTDPAVLGYIAGMFDGEGNLYWRRRTERANSVRVAIYSTTPKVLEWIQTTVGGYVRWEHKRVVRHPTWKPMGIWEISSNRDTVALLTALLPYLIIKRDLARLTLADLTRYTEIGGKVYR